MRGPAIIIMPTILLGWCIEPAASERLRWQTFPPIVASALAAFRNSENGLADEITMNLDGPRTGRTVDGERPMNFDAATDLLWIVADVNRDGRSEVFLLLPFGGGNRVPWGVVMQQVRGGWRALHGGWRVACEFQDGGFESRNTYHVRGSIQMLERRSQGWRHFRVFSGTYGWQRAPEGDGAMDCVPLAETPPR